MTTIDYKNMIQKDCIFLNLKVADRHELFEQVGEKLKRIGYVKDTYVDALNEREAEFPTGLMTKYLPISLPHVDSVNVNRAFIAVVKMISLFICYKWVAMRICNVNIFSF